MLHFDAYSSQITNLINIAMDESWPKQDKKDLLKLIKNLIEKKMKELK